MTNSMSAAEFRKHRFKGRGRGRKPKGTMNKMEAAYLAHLQDDPTIAYVGFETVTLKLAHDCRYTVDFVVVRTDGTIELHEVKGFMEDDALVKLKVCATVFWMFPLFLVTGKPGAWKVEEVKVA